MKQTTQWLGTVSAITLAVAPSVANAAAVGTAANSVISNSVTVSYNVGGNAQTPITSAADTLTVDKKVDVVVTTQDSAAVTVSPNQTNAVTTFTVTNNSNATMDFLLTATQQSAGSAKFGGTDSIDVNNVRVYIETNGTAGWQAGDTQATSLAAIASGDAATVYIVSDIPTSAAQGAIATVVLKAQAASGVTVSTGYAGTGGSALAASAAGPNGKNTMETVFADTASDTSTGDADKDGFGAARSDYKVDTAVLAVSKVSRVVSDPVNGTTNPKAIPGAVVEYCIVVSNSSTTVDATSVSVADQIDSTKLTSVTVPTVGGTYTAATSTCSGGSAGTWSTIDTSTTPTTYKYTVGTVAKNTSATPSLVRFQATIK